VIGFRTPNSVWLASYSFAPAVPDVFEEVAPTVTRIGHTTTGESLSRIGLSQAVSISRIGKEQI
jgi:hypothetical protein